jgi:MYXO-CTERM domain-containing protein
VYIAAVGRADPRTLFLRVLGLDDGGRSFDQIATSFDGGDTVAAAATIPGARFTAVLERGDGTVLATGWTTPPAGATAGSTPLALRSEDGGRSFAPWSLALHVRALAERGGVLFAAADDTAGGEFALGTSGDGGSSWAPRLRFKDIAGIRPCLQSFCFADCQVQVAVGLFNESVCSPDGGTSTGAPPAGAAGCACSTTACWGDRAGLPAVLAVAAVAGLARRRRRRFTGSPWTREGRTGRGSSS